MYADYPGKPSGIPFFLRHGLETCAYTGAGGGVSPDYTNTMLIQAMVDTITALGKAFDGDPRLAFLGAGFLGYWGEWHTDSECPFASDQVQRTILVALNSSFQTCRLLLRYPDETGGLMSPTANDLPLWSVAVFVGD